MSTVAGITLLVGLMLLIAGMQYALKEFKRGQDDDDDDWPSGIAV